MNYGFDYLTAINPWAHHELRDMPQGRVNRGFVGSGGATCVYGFDQLLFSGQTRSEALRLMRLNISSAWVGSPVAQLLIRQNGLLLHDHDQVWINDVVPLHWIRRLNTTIAPHSQWTISFVNLTDTRNDRPALVTISGVYFRP